MKVQKEKVMGTKKWFYWVSIGVVLILIYKLLDNFSGIGSWFGNLLSILAPFLEGILIAYILYSPCKKIETRIKKFKNKFISKHARIISIAMIYITVIVLVFLFMNVIIPTIVSSIADLISNAQTYYNAVISESPNLSIAPFIQDNILKPVVDFIQNMDFSEFFTIEKIKEYLSSAMGVVKGIVNIFIALICSVYILLQRERIVRYIKKLAKAMLSSRGYEKFQKYFSNGNQIFFKYLWSQMLDCIIVAIITSIAMSIMGVKYSVLLGILIGISNLVPYFGAIFGVAIAVIITLLTGGWEQALIMAIVVIVLQQIDANLINPRITSQSLKVSPLLVMFSVTVGGAYLGAIGMLLGVPFFTLLKLVIDDFASERIQEKEKIELEEKNIEELK